MDIREIEKIIDYAHENHNVFRNDKKQAMFNVLSTFEDVCAGALFSSVLNPYAVSNIVDNMDALNMALVWINSLCYDGDNASKEMITLESYEDYVDLLNNYAYPYSSICSGYIAYSRKYFDCKIVDNNVEFNVIDSQNNSVWYDILRECEEYSSIDFLNGINVVSLILSGEIIKESISVEDGCLCYELSENTINTFKDVALQQWNSTKTLPDDWGFDEFSMKEYKDVWTTLTAICYIHFIGCSYLKDDIERINNRVIYISKKEIIDVLQQLSHVDKDVVEKIINYISYDANRKNVDIMYQPIINYNDDFVMIAPTLFIGSRPERNLLCLVCNTRDSTHSKEVNELEGLMVKELELYTKEAIISKNRKLADELPDIDFAILDKKTRSVLLCELKWFMAADSTKEVFAREEDISHGCEQMESIMTFVFRDKKSFIKNVFGFDDDEEYDVFCCVISKNNVRTRNNVIPVIGLNRIIELFSTHEINDVFHIIRNHEYEIKMPDTALITHKEITYSNFIFKIPAICFGEKF